MSTKLHAKAIQMKELSRKSHRTFFKICCLLSSLLNYLELCHIPVLPVLSYFEAFPFSAHHVLTHFFSFRYPVDAANKYTNRVTYTLSIKNVVKIVIALHLQQLMTVLGPSKLFVVCAEAVIQPFSISHM